MNNSSTSISCSRLVFKRGARTVLGDVSFNLKKGTLTALIGHNGAGKSTLLKLVLGLLTPFSGSLTVLGAAPGSDPLKVGYLPENVSFYDQMTVGEHLDYFSALKSVGRSRVEELVAQLGLIDVIGQKLSQCSKGQRQRLGLAQALLTSPELLILDEPTVGLDPAASLLMYRELSKLRDAGCSVVVCTHELALVEHYLDNALVLSHGRLAGAGTLDELRAQASLAVKIAHVDLDKIKAHAKISMLVRGNELLVRACELEAVVEMLTRECGIFDFEVKKADLGEIFRYFVLNEKDLSAEAH